MKKQKIAHKIATRATTTNILGLSYNTLVVDECLSHQNPFFMRWDGTPIDPITYRINQYYDGPRTYDLLEWVKEHGGNYYVWNGAYHVEIPSEEIRILFLLRWT